MACQGRPGRSNGGGYGRDVEDSVVGARSTRHGLPARSVASKWCPRRSGGRGLVQRGLVVVGVHKHVRMLPKSRRKGANQAR
ncbi:hypothetical protein E2562_006921 [Oryza meyeriana var. granulata]|uniref:Uncharacterized protein n=1 Tax=Oryza meyeriana var. granulata TaxID=110450 RepID=A0A6G1BI42_9ORYZ|nr:hypothetical protein E2562_006921 [Oryza meyeriana var. granulata]